MNAHSIAAVLTAFMTHEPTVNSAVFNTMRILKQVNPGDTYYENYLGHYAKRGKDFVDVYHLIWAIGAYLSPEYILEIGTRTGISLCQLLSPMITHIPEEIITIDPFDDGYTSPHLVKRNMHALNFSDEMIDKVSIIKGRSADYLPKLENKFDYILVDGDHAKIAARNDLEESARLCNSPGIILFDDIGEDGCALDDVWERFSDHREEFVFLDDHNGKGVGAAVKL